MTLAAVKKLAIELPPKQRLQLADALYESLPILPGSVGLAELERRADEVISGKVKGIPWEEFQRDLREMRKSITPKRIHRGGRACRAHARSRDLKDERNAALGVITVVKTCKRKSGDPEHDVRACCPAQSSKFSTPDYPPQSVGPLLQFPSSISRAFPR